MGYPRKYYKYIMFKILAKNMDIFKSYRGSKLKNTYFFGQFWTFFNFEQRSILNILIFLAKILNIIFFRSFLADPRRISNKNLVFMTI